MSGSPGRAETLPKASTPTDYLGLYGLSKPPFGGADDRRGYILLNSHRRVFEMLVDHLINGRGLVILRGAEGVGKSTMLAAAAQLAAEAGRDIIKPAPPLVGRLDLPQLLATILGQPSSGASTVADLPAALRRLAGPPCAVLLIDDLDRLTAACLPVLIAIAQQTDDPPAMVVTAAADPRNHAAQGALARQARSELRIPRLSPAEIREYIERSLWIAGATTRRLLTPDALRLIIASSNGLPGSIDRLMETILTAGFARGDALISGRTVAATLAPAKGRRHDDKPRRTALVFQVTAVGLLLIGVAAFLYRGLDAGSAVGTAVSTVPVAVAPEPVEVAPARPVAMAAPAKPAMVVPARPATAAPIPAAEPPPPPLATLEPKPPATGAPAGTLSAELIDTLMRRGEQSLGLGDIAAARLLFQRAAEAGHAPAATAMGRTYDPAFPVTGADTARAAEWYRKAISMGDPAAADLLQRLSNTKKKR